MKTGHGVLILVLLILMVSFVFSEDCDTTADCSDACDTCVDDQDGYGVCTLTYLPGDNEACCEDSGYYWESFIFWDVSAGEWATSWWCVSGGGSGGGTSGCGDGFCQSGEESTCPQDCTSCDSLCASDLFVNNTYSCINDFSTLVNDTYKEICNSPGLCNATYSPASIFTSVNIDCLPGCCADGQSSCQAPTFNQDSDCSSTLEPGYLYECYSNWYDIYGVGSMAFNTSAGDSCDSSLSCYEVPTEDPLGNLEECQFGCSSVGGPCEHRYCIDLDQDGYANETDCYYASKRNSLPLLLDYVRTDYRYEISEDELNWEDAQASCVAKGGNLAQVTDWLVDSETGELNTEIRDLLNEQFLGQEYWVGLKDKDDLYFSSNFYWPKGNILNPLLEEYWANSQPSYTYLAAKEDCVVVQMGGDWNDEYCWETKKYVCELPYVFDCDDDDVSVNPNATEIVGDGMDNDCSGLIDDVPEELVVQNTSWVNLRGGIATVAQVYDTVLMSAKGQGLNESQLNYSVLQDTSILGWIITRELRFINSSLDLTPLYIPSGDRIVYFNVAVSDGNISRSNDLSIGDGEGNFEPYAKINYPEQKVNYLQGTIVDFNATVYDEDDFLDVTWYFGDGTSKTFEDYAQAINSSSSLSVSHTYPDNECGTYNILLSAKETGESRKQVIESFSEIYVYKEGICVFPVVSSPENGKTDYSNLVRFDARESFITNCSRGTMDNKAFTVGDLNCSYIHAPGQEVVGDEYNLFVEWTVNPPNQKYGGEWGLKLYPELGSSSYTIQNFVKYFGTDASRTAQLKLIYTD